MNQSDASAIARVRAESWRAAYRGIVPDAFLDGMDVGGWADVYRRLLENPPEKMASFVVEADAKVVGMAATSPDRDDDTPYSAELLMIYLALGYWRRGIGQKLMHATTTWLIGQGMASMIVWGLAENWPADDFMKHWEASTSGSVPPISRVLRCQKFLTIGRTSPCWRSMIRHQSRHTTWCQPARRECKHAPAER